MRLALATIALASCWTGKPQPAEPLMNTTTRSVADSPDHTGAYWCALNQQGYDYDQFPCVIRADHGHWRFAKLGGSVRLRGFVKFDEAGNFRFRGEQYCPWGDCTEAVAGTFTLDGNGGFKATVGDMGITMVPATPEQYGGASYGGDGYGDPYGYSGSVGGQGYGSPYGRNRVIIPMP